MDFGPKSTRSEDVPFTEDDWPQQRIYGDFYREPVEDITRGVSLADGLGMEPASSFKFGSDYYREQEDVFKGLTLEQLPEENSFCQNRHPWSWGSSTTAGTKDEELYKGLTSKFYEDTAPLREAYTGTEFQQVDEPPPVPTDPYWRPEATTAHVETNTPWQIGNHLLSFLTSELSSPNLKVSRKPKFAIKADAFVGTVFCTLKIRVYFIENEKYSVEFQRRAGCCIAFNRAFSQAVKFLSSRFTMQEAMASPPICASPMSEAEVDQISPLLDMAMTSRSSLQAESVATLSDLSEDPIAAQSLLREDVFQELARLLKSRSHPEVSFPACRLVSNLAKLRQAAQYFSVQGFLPTMIEKVHNGTYGEVRELAQALHLVMGHVCLDEQQHDRVTRQLQVVIKDMAPSHTARPLLEQALLTLRRKLA